MVEQVLPAALVQAKQAKKLSSLTAVIATMVPLEGSQMRI